LERELIGKALKKFAGRKKDILERFPLSRKGQDVMTAK
jgi:hypothetical protein